MPSPEECLDLIREREFASIKSEDFAEWWAGGREALLQRRALEKHFYDDEELKDTENTAHMSHKELYEYSLIKSTKFIRKLKAYQQDKGAASADNIQSMYDFRLMLVGPLGYGILPQGMPFRLHFSMFLPSILRLCTDEQQKKWLDKALRMDGIMGAYAQTELGHGTNLKALETRADYDEKTQEFILNSPSLSAYKWWPGTLGLTANMAIVMAQLYVKGQHHGLHAFLVRIRDEDTHFPLPGVDVGEIGPILGSKGVNNGFLGLKNVRIPRTQMLMKNAQVMPDGTFRKGAIPLLTYGTMVFVRVYITKDISFSLLQAATIATRYSAVRRQGFLQANQPETQILDYVTQQAKIFPQIAKGVFYRMAADNVWALYQKVVEELDAGDGKNLPELHAISCTLKAVCTLEGADGVEILRKSTGGHGYLMSSNFSQIYGVATAACTYEGENTVLLLQTARFLTKNYFEGLKRKVLPSSVAYLRNVTPLSWSSKELVKSIVRALEITAMEKTRLAYEYQRLQRKQNDNELMANNMAGLKLTQAATLHGRAFLARIASEEVKRQRNKMKPEVYLVLKQLLEIFVLDLFFNSLGDILQFCSIKSTQVADVEHHYEQTMAAFRKNAVAVVDGFDFHDRILNSTLGCYDGRVYERLMEEARKSPLNQEPVNKTFETHLKPLLSGKL